MLEELGEDDLTGVHPPSLRSFQFQIVSTSFTS